MAIYTEISFSQVQLILKDYNIGHLKKLIGIKKGIENTNYLLVTSKNKFILTIYEKRVNSKFDFSSLKGKVWGGGGGGLFYYRDDS